MVGADGDWAGFSLRGDFVLRLAYVWYFCQLNHKTLFMRVLAIILIVGGIAMILVRGFSVQTEKNVVDIGPLKVNKKENKWIGWPTYAGALVAVAGVVVLVSAKKN